MTDPYKENLAEFLLRRPPDRHSGNNGSELAAETELSSAGRWEAPANSLTWTEYVQHGTEQQAANLCRDPIFCTNHHWKKCCKAPCGGNTPLNIGNASLWSCTSG